MVIKVPVVIECQLISCFFVEILMFWPQYKLHRHSWPTKLTMLTLENGSRVANMDRGQPEGEVFRDM